MGHLLSGCMVGLVVTSSKKAYATACVTQVAEPRIPAPWGRPLLTRNSTGDLNTGLVQSCGVSGSWCSPGFVWAFWVSLVGMGFDSKCDFSPSTILLGLLLCPWTWGIFFFFFFGGIQHSPVNDCSAVSCNFGVLTEEDEWISFYSVICLEGHWHWHFRNQ